MVTRDIHPDALERLSQVGHLKIWRGPGPIPSAVLQDWLKEAHACLAMLTERFDANLLGSLEKLRIVANMAVGFDNIDVDYAHQNHIIVTNTPDVLTAATADLTMALLLALTRNLVSSRDDLLQGRWRSWDPNGFLGEELAQKTLGIVGLGRIGSAVAHRARAFGMTIIALSRTGGASQRGGIPLMPRQAFLHQADIVSLHAPLTPSTLHLVDDTWLEGMKPGSYLINTARGELVDETALLQALNQGKLRGAALDVFEREPITGDHPLAGHPGVLATPHIGSATRQTRRAMALRAVDNIVAVLSGAKPLDPVLPRTRTS